MLKINEIFNIRTYPQYPRKIIISWEVGGDLPYPLGINIFRSGSKEGPFEKLNSSIITGFYYEDFFTKPLSKISDIYYKLEFIAPTEDPQFTEPFAVIPSPRLSRSYFIARRMDQKYGIEYKAHSGVDFSIYKRKHWGTRCTKCYNPVTESATKANCLDCFGTTFEGGYWDPVKTLGKVEPLVKTQTLQGDLNFSEDITSSLSLRAFPLVKKGDFVVEESSNRRWYIHTVQLTEHGRFPVKQTCEIRLIEKNSILYRLK